METNFKGFPKETVDFLEDLSINNNKPWFEEHKKEYEKNVVKPSKDFVVAMGKLLKEIVPAIHADPRTNKSLFRIYRDTRFSKDKSPYKTHLGIFFWEGERKKMECSGFYFHIEPGKLFLGGGIHTFPKDLLEEYRKAVITDYGNELVEIISDLETKGYSIGKKHYKRVPRGFDKDHENAELLLHNGMSVYLELPIPEELFSEEILDFCIEKFTDMLPLHQWLVKISE